MTGSEVDWVPALLVLAVAVVLGAIAVARMKRGTAPLPPQDERASLEAERDGLIAQLRELGPDTEMLERRRDLERGAAQVLMRLDALPAADAVAAASPETREKEPPPQAAPAPRSSLAGFLWGIGSAVAVGLLLYAVSDTATERGAGEPVTGNVGPAESETAADPELETLDAAVRRNPEDLDARLALAQRHLMRQDLMAVFEQTQYVLEREPRHPQALAYQSLVRLAMGQADLAEQMLKQALEVEPDYLEAYVHLALVYARTGQGEQAEAAIAEASRRHPSEAEMLGRLLSEIRTAAAAEPLPAGDAHPAVPGPPSDRGGPPSPAASTGPGYAGQIRLDPGFSGSIAPGAVIFLTVREEGYATGAPNAAKRFPIGAFPMAFQVGAGDSMMGGELPESARIEARVDSDGDVMSRDPQDPIAVLDGVPLGAEDIDLVLRTP